MLLILSGGEAPIRGGGRIALLEARLVCLLGLAPTKVPSTQRGARSQGFRVPERGVTTSAAFVGKPPHDGVVEKWGLVAWSATRLGGAGVACRD